MNTAVERILAKAQLEIRAVTACNKARVVVIGLEDARDKDIYKQANELIIECCTVWNVDINAMRSNSRKRVFVLPRQASAFILKELYTGKISLIRMASIVGYIDHSDFLHAFNKAKDLIDIKDDMITDYLNAVKHLYHEQTAN